MAIKTYYVCDNCGHEVAADDLKQLMLKHDGSSNGNGSGNGNGARRKVSKRKKPGRKSAVSNKQMGLRNRRIVAALDRGTSAKVLAARYDLTPQHVRNIARREKRKASSKA